VRNHRQVFSAAAPGARPGVWVLVLVALLVAAGCASVPKRVPLAVDQIDEAVIPGIPYARSWGDAPPPNVKVWLAKTSEQLEAEHPALFGKPHTYLALSGGGPRGAFGAGLMVGWTEAGDRPEFSMVTGVSTGALMAPFVFLGPAYDDVLKVLYTETSTEDIADMRNKLNGVTSDALASSTPLQELISTYVDEPLMQVLAAEHNRGRRLWIGTTNLDAQRPVIWNLGLIAASGDPGALHLIRQVLLASASLPGGFPPVLIPVEAGDHRYDEMHVDGGAASQVFLYPIGIDWREVLRKLQVPGRPRVYLVRNARLRPEWEAVANKFTSILFRSVDSLIRTQGIGDLYRIYLAAQRDGMDFNLVRIPDTFHEEATEMFDPVYMGKLFLIGREMGRVGVTWDKMPPEMVPAAEAEPAP
jgi:hypothetical protein